MFPKYHQLIEICTDYNIEVHIVTSNGNTKYDNVVHIIKHSVPSYMENSLVKSTQMIVSDIIMYSVIDKYNKFNLLKKAMKVME